MAGGVWILVKAWHMLREASIVDNERNAAMNIW